MSRTLDAPGRPVTADELLRMPDDGVRRELVRGEVRTMTPAGRQHGKIAMRIGAHLAGYVEEQQLGEVYAAETGFRIGSDPDTVRAPDVAYLSRARVDETGEVTGFAPGPPDLAVEVLSPHDRFEAVEEKVFDWLDAGTRMVIVVNPAARSATIFRSRSEIVVLTEEEAIDGLDVVPGWTLPVREIFAG
jgi:Uma2 family endonuclease